MSNDEESRLEKILGRTDVPEDVKSEIRRMNQVCAVAEESISALFISDLDGKVTYANHTAARMWGFKDSSEMIGTSVLDYWTEASKVEADKIMHRLSKHEVYTGEGLVGKRKDGSEFIVALHAALTKDSSGKPAGMDATARRYNHRRRSADCFGRGCNR